MRLIPSIAMLAAITLAAICPPALAQETVALPSEPPAGRVITPALVPLGKLSVERLGPGVTRQVVHGTQSTFSRWELKAGAKVLLHHHTNEQISWIISGKSRVTSGGKQYVMEAGDIMVFPPNVEHAFEVLEDTVAVDIFAPQRQDWIDQAAAGK